VASNWCQAERQGTNVMVWTVNASSVTTRVEPSVESSGGRGGTPTLRLDRGVFLQFCPIAVACRSCARMGIDLFQ
jgi:hypothetical protein